MHLFLNLKSRLGLFVALVCLIPFTVNADVGIVAIAVDASSADKGAFEANAGINEGDVISTGKNGNLTILFDDESMLTLGPDTKAEIVKFSTTPAPGVSKIKIISGSFNFFPGTILENGGQQLVTNLATSAQSVTTDKPDNNIAASVQPQFSTPDSNGFATANSGATLNTVNTTDIAPTTISVTEPMITLVVASSGATDGANGGNTSVSGVEMDEPAVAAPEPTFTLDPAFHIDATYGVHRKDSPDNGHTPHL